MTLAWYCDEMMWDEKTMDSSSSFLVKRRETVVRSGPRLSPRSPCLWHLMHWALVKIAVPRDASARWASSLVRYVSSSSNECLAFSGCLGSAASGSLG